MRRHTPKIVLLLTKADLLTEAQLAFVQAQTRGKCDGDLPVFFYSVHPALAPLKEELVEQLLMSLRRGRGEATGAILTSHSWRRRRGQPG